MTQSETTSAAGGPLWCMHIQGPDDLHAAPDFWTALAWAAELNSFIAEKAAKGNWKADDNYPLSQAVVRQWTGTPESHAVQCEIELADRAEHEAKRKAAALAAPTAKGGTEAPAGWAMVPEHPTPEMMGAFWRTKNTGATEIGGAHVDSSDVAAFRAYVAASPPPPAGAAGGGSGDLAALSAGATPEIKATQITLGEGLVDIGPITHEGRVGVLFRPRAEHIPFGQAGELQECAYWPGPNDVVLWVSGEGPQVAIDALAALAPTPGMGAQGEPVAQGTLADEPYDPLKAAVWQALTPFMVEMMQTGGVTFMGLRNAVVAAVRPLYEAPAALRTGSGVSVEEIASWINERCVAVECDRDAELEGTAGAGYCNGQLEAYETVLRRLALFAQAPRDGGGDQ